MHLNHGSGEVVYVKCCCKEGQMGCCKHNAALLYAFLDFVNLDFDQIPQDLTCTQVGPPDSSKTLKKSCEIWVTLVWKAKFNKKCKRPLLSGIRGNYWATPPFARPVTKDEKSKWRNCGRYYTKSAESITFWNQY